MLEPICTILAWLCCSTREVTTIASWLFSGLTHWEGRRADYIYQGLSIVDQVVYGSWQRHDWPLLPITQRKLNFGMPPTTLKKTWCVAWSHAFGWVSVHPFSFALRDGITISKNVFESSTMRLMVGVGWGAFGELNADRFLLCCVSPRAFA